MNYKEELTQQMLTDLYEKYVLGRRICTREKDALKAALQEITDSVLITRKQDYAAVMRVIEDCDLYCCSRYVDFINMLKDMEIDFPKQRNIRPSADNLRRVKFSRLPAYRYPNWKVRDGREGDLARYLHIAEVFLRAYHDHLEPLI